MRVVNKLTKPGDIRRVDLMPDTVRVQTSDGQDRLYRLVLDCNMSKEAEQGEDNLSLCT